MKIVVDVFLLLISHDQFNSIALFDSLINVLKKKFMVTFFDSEDIMTVMLFKILNVRRIVEPRESSLIITPLISRAVFASAELALLDEAAARQTIGKSKKRSICSYVASDFKPDVCIRAILL